jgi:mannan endo-1,4-beta-mannosidase
MRGIHTSKVILRGIVLEVLLSGAYLSAAQVFEAEGGLLTGTQVSTQRTGYRGTGFVTGFDNDKDEMLLKVRVEPGIYDIYIRYASPFGNKFDFLVVNGENLGSVFFEKSESFQETKAGKIHIRAGENTIAIKKDWGYVDFDNFRLEASQASDFTTNVSPSLITTSPAYKADSLYQFLRSVYGKIILSGQYGGVNEFNIIRTLSGKTPVIRGFDLIDYSPTRVERGTTSQEVENAIEWSHGRGIVIFCWHWNAPGGLIDQPGSEWWRGFYADATTFDVSKAMNDPQSEEYSLIIRDIDAIAVQLKRLQDANVPVLWRPLHEAEGAWFWWGAKGAESCMWLWKLLYQRLAIHHGLNNLIWVWTSTDRTTALDWYPGHTYVDLISADIYLPAGHYSSNFRVFDNLVALFGGKKIIALSENGALPDAERLFVNRAAWSWFATWSGGFITDGISNTPEQIDAVFNHEYVITLDEIDSISRIVERLEERRQEPEGEDDVVSIQANPLNTIEFQNPVNKTLPIKSADEKIISIRVFAEDGAEQKIKTEFKGSEAFLSFEDNKAGLYLVCLRTERDTRVFRIIVLK